MFQIEDYLQRLIPLLKNAFHSRLIYVGLQGSYRRGEATDHSDLDIMVVLDQLAIEDMVTYRNIISSLEHYELSCGFICGMNELSHWNACEIWQLLHDTVDCYGELQPLVPAYTRDDIQTHIKISVGNLYHEICHRYIHASLERNKQQLKVSYQTVFYILQNLYYLHTGQYASSKKELLLLLNGNDHKVLATAMDLKHANEYDFASAYSLLFTWCQEILHSIDEINRQE